MRRLLLFVALLWLGGCASPPSAQAGVLRVDEVRRLGSLRGTDLDGDWGSWHAGTLQSDLALRRRFSHLLTAVGELDLRELRLWIAREVAREHGDASVGQVLVAWDDHLALQQGNPTPSQAAAGNPAPPSMPPRHRATAAPAPRALLMPEASLSAQQLQALQVQRVEALGAEAAERLLREDAARWAWAQRMAEARTQLQNLSGSARDAFLARHFSGSERLRARALLGFPP